MSTEDWYAKNLAQLWAKPDANEADLSGALIRPVLANELGFGVAEIDAESETVSGTGKRIRPDFVCGNPNTEFAYVLVEVKRLGTALDQRKGRQGMSTSPAGQLRRYLKGHRRAGVGTWGVLTNGTDWLVVQRTDEDCPWGALSGIYAKRARSPRFGPCWRRSGQARPRRYGNVGATKPTWIGWTL